METRPVPIAGGESSAGHASAPAPDAPRRDDPAQGDHAATEANPWPPAPAVPGVPARVLAPVEAASPPSPPHAGLGGWEGDDALASFPTEEEVRASKRAAARKATAIRRLANLTLLLALLMAGLVFAWRWFAPPGAGSTPPASTGTVSIESVPAGAVVTIDGRERGATPLTVPVAAGTHRLLLQHGELSRELSVSVPGGTQVVHHIELAAPVSPAQAGSGRLHVASTPAAAQVVFDGTPRGKTPLDLADIAPGNHTITVGEGEAAVTQRVTVPAGGTASLVVPLLPAEGSSAPGWLSVACPVEVQIFEKDELVGTSRTGRILMLSGRHTLRLANPELQFEATRTVQLASGRTHNLRLEIPDGSLSVNAVPWAEVLMDGRRIGETPIANLAVPIGAHELVFRNPKFPEQKRTVTVAASSPLRVGVDLRK